jgi:ferredoxin
MPFAIGMREGVRQPLQELVGLIVVDGEREIEMRRKPVAAFPFLARPERCDGCGECVRLCPTDALQVVSEILLSRSTGPATIQ